jgi:hypothetical protein
MTTYHNPNDDTHATSTSATSTSLPCYADNLNGQRTFSSASTTSDQMTNVYCKSYCSSRNYAYSGTEYSRGRYFTICHTYRKLLIISRMLLFEHSSHCHLLSMYHDMYRSHRNLRWTKCTFCILQCHDSCAECSNCVGCIYLYRSWMLFR